MNKKLILITCFVFCFFITLSAVSAAEDTGNETLSSDDQPDTLKTNDDNEILNKTNEYILNDGEGSFTELYGEINGLSDGQTLELHRDYLYKDSDAAFKNGIYFSKNNIIIDGKGHKIDGAGVARILQVGATSNGHAAVSGVTIRNMTFVNAHNEYWNQYNYQDSNGRDAAKNNDFGAIEFWGTGNVENCNFINGYAWCAAGIAIGGGSGQGVTISNCKFINNTGYGTGGGAVRLRTEAIGITLYKCWFENNTGISYGGAVHSDSGRGNWHITVDNCDFVNNNAGLGAGGLFFETTGGVVTNSRFANNTAPLGGALYWNGYEGEVSYCNFTGNDASDKGGAIYTSKRATTNITTSNFKYNSANYGGAIYFDNTTSSAISNCSFYNNTAKYDGGAVYCNGQFFTVLNSNFTKDSAKNNGGAIFLDVGAYVYKCQFEQEHADVDGGGIYLYSKVTQLPSLPEGIELGVFSTNFTTCSAGHNGGAGYVNSNWGVVEDTILKDCTAVNDGGAGYIKGDYGKLRNSQLISNFASGNGGALYWEGSEGTITNTIYRENKARGNGGGIYWKGDNGNITDCNFTTNIGIGNSDGGSIYVEGDNLNITYADFKHGSAKDGSAIYIKGANTNVLHSNFTEIGSVISEGIDDTTRGGSIYIEGHNAVIYDGIFKRNNAGRGGSIYIEGNDAGISYSTFEFTTVTHDGSAIYISGDGTNITHSNFSRAYANDDGGAIYVGGDNTHITHSSFEYLNATRGGAIFIKGSGNVIQSDFSYCFAVGGRNPLAGGAIYVEGDDNDISNSTFTTNMAIGGNGGAIYVAGDKNEIYNITTSTTAATRNGGAIYIEGNDTNITVSRFQFGSAENGGAIYIEGQNAHILHSNITQFGATAHGQISQNTKGGGAYIAGYKTVIDDVLFMENNAANGGSLYITGNEATIKNSNFTRTKSTLAGGAMYIMGNKTHVENSDFTFSVTDGDGGAVYVGGVGTQIRSSSFSFTNATHGGAIYIEGDDTCIESNFDHTFARNNRSNPGAGGAIFISGDNNKVCNSNFTITMAITGSGGAIYAGGFNTTIYNIHSDIAQAMGGGPGMGNGGAIYISGNSSKVLYSTFKHYNATLNGGGLYVEGNNVNISHSSFEYGEATFGAGVYINGHDTYMEWSNFTHNHANVNGGIIYIEGNHSTIADSRLEYSYANASGGAVFINGENNLITNSILTHNNATRLYGGSIYINGAKNNITYSKFEFCTSTRGGAIYINGTEAHIIHSNFTQNGVNPELGITEGTSGGAIYIAGSKAIVSHDRFAMSQASEGGFIFISGDDAEVSHSIFAQSVAFREGGAIDIHGNDALITESSFMMSNATLMGGAISVEGHGVNITNSNFTITTVVNPNPQIRTAGGAIYVGGNDGDVVNCKFNITRAVSGDGGSIYVTGNRTNVADSNFTISLAIQGDGGVLYVSGNNVTLDNCNSVISQATGSQRGPNVFVGGEGGAVYISGENVTVQDSQFRQYNATYHGGAIFVNGDNTDIIQTTLEYGQSQYGGSIYIEGENTHLTNSTLTHNHATADGGVIYIKGDGAEIFNSVLEFSYSERHGGSIYIEGENTKIIKSNLTYNNATNANGGSIYIEGNNTNITGSNFGFSTSINGGALYIGGTNTTVADSTFRRHTATNEGGAIYIAGDDTKIKTSNFTECLAKNGAAIYVDGNNATILGCNLTRYIASHYGGAVYIDGNNVNVSNSYFEYGEAVRGGSMYIKGDNAYIDGSNFKRNHASQDGGVIYIEGHNSKINNSNFKSSYSNQSGGTIYIKGVDTVIYNSIFLNNNATQKMGGSIYIEGARTNITGSSFTNCSSREGGVLYVKGDNATIHASNFTRNLAISQDNNTGGGSIYILGENAVISYSNFTQSKAKDGGIIYIRGSQVNITHSNFDRSEAYRQGGAVYVAGINATIDSSTFSRHNATLGGAVYISGQNTNIIDSNFSYAHASNQAGAIFLGPRTYVYNSTFTNNTAYSGGAMYNSGGTAIVELSNFTSNRATSTGTAHGGAIYWLGGSNYDAIMDCYFEDNQAISTDGHYACGGAIYWSNGGGSTRNARIINSTFVNNLASRHGGAIDWFSSDDGRIEDCTFINNTARSDGGALYAGDDGSTGKNLTVKNCNFTGNHANVRGGALSLQFGNSHIIDCNFTSQTASEGGSIYSRNSKASNCEYVNCKIIDSKTTGTDRSSGNGGGAFICTKYNKFINCEFINCSVLPGKNGGGMYFDLGADFNYIDGCNFTNCTAILPAGSGDGGAIYVCGVNNHQFVLNLTVHNSTFRNVSARNGGAIYMNAVNATIDNSTFIGSHAAENGGAIYVGSVKDDTYVGNSISHSNIKDGSAAKGGAIYLRAFNNSVDNSCITGNLAANGAGIYLENTDGNLISNTNITNNNATRGSGIYAENSKYNLTNVKLIENQAHASEFTNKSIRIDDDGRYYVTAIFRGEDNLLNAIWNDESSQAVNFTNVVYWGAQGIKTTNSVPELNNAEAGINITVTRIKTRAPGEVVVTDKDGAFKYYFEDDGSVEFKFSFTHYEDNYYTGLTDETSILATNVTIEVDDIAFGDNATVNVTLTDRDGNKLTANVTVSINNTYNFTIEVKDGFGSINNVSGLNAGIYNATVTFKGNETYLGSRNSTLFTVHSAVNITIIKTAIDTNVSVGDLVNYTIIVTNNGPSNATNVSVWDNLPAGLVYVKSGSNITDKGVKSLIGNVERVTWIIGNLTKGQSVLLWVQVNTTINGTIGNVAVVNSTEGGENSSNITNITVNPKVNLTVIKYSNITGNASVGDLVKFTITVTNNGPSNATNVTIFDKLNPAFEIVSAPGNKTISGNNVTWIIPHLANRTSASVYVIVRLLTNGTFENVACVSSVENKTNSTNGTNITVKPVVDLVINKTVSKTEVLVGDTVVYTITVKNNGPSNATGVYVIDELDKRLELIGVYESQGTYDNRTGRWTIGNITKDGNVTLKLTVKILANGTIPNFANVTGNENDTNITNNNVTSDNITANPKVNLTVIKTVVTTGTIYVGDLVNYTITVTNHGPSNATNVQIVDNLNVGLKFVLANGTYTNSNQRVNWTVPFIANGTSATVWIQVRVLTNGTIENVAVVNSTENKTTTGNGTNITINPQVNLTVVKTIENNTAHVGDLVNFTIIVTNDGLSNATGINITDFLPAGMQYIVSGINITGGRVTNATLANGTTKVTWHIPLLNNKSSVKIWIQVNLTTNGTFRNVAVATSNENTTNTTNGTNITVKPAVDLVITKTVNKTDVLVGDTVEYVINVTNKGPSNATGVYVIDKLDKRLELIWVYKLHGTYDNSTGIWTVGNITSGASVTLRLVVKVLANGTIPNFANVTGNENDTNITNNNVTSDNITANPKVNLTVVKTVVTTGTIYVGDLVNYTITVTNHGPSNATNVQIVDNLNAALRFVLANGTYTNSTQRVNWTVPFIANGTSVTVWIQVRVLTNGTIENVALVNSTENKTTTGNGTNITVNPQVNLTVVKTADNVTANVGDLVNFTIVVTNNGLSNATGVNVTDFLPAGMAYIGYGTNATGVTVTNTTLSNGTTKVVWNIPLINNKTCIKIWIQVNLTTNGTFTNIAVVNSTENKTATSNGTNITVKPVVDLVINKTVNKTDVLVGDVVEYIINVTNKGPSNATGVYVIDKLDNRLEFVRVIPTQGSYDNATGKWTIGNITSGASVTLKLIVKVLTNGTIPNFANVTGNENDTNITNNNVTSDNITANPKVNLTVIKTVVTNGTIYVGDLVNYTITVTNHGPSNATNVQIIDVLIPEFRFSSANGTYTHNGQKVNWTISFIANGTNVTVWIQVKVLANGTLKNIASVNCSENKTDVPSNITNVTVNPQVNLTVIKTIANDTAHVGDLVNFTIIVTNNGLSNATNVTVVDMLPLGMIYKNAGSNITDCPVYNRILDNQTHKVTWVISKIMNGTSVKLWVLVNLTTNGTFRNVAVVNSTENNTDVSNGTNITVKPTVNLIINKTVNKTEAYVGDIVKYTIEISNKGPSNATGIKVTDCLDDKLEFVNSTATYGSYNETTHIWTINNITSGGNATLTIFAKIISNGTIPNIAIVNCTENTTNKNASSENITAKAQVNLTVIKTANVTGTIYVGDIVNYTITVTNNGLSNATNVTVVDDLIAAFKFEDSNKTYVKDGQKITWTIDRLENGTSVSFWIAVKVLTNGTLSNFVVVNSTENTTDVPSNVTNVTVEPKVNLTIIKTFDKVNASVGELVNFTIIVTNYGPSNATGVNVTDLLPLGMIYKDSGSSFTGLKGHVDVTNSSRVMWNIDKIMNGTSVKLWVLVNLTTNGTFRNVAVVKSNENTTNTTNGTNITVKPAVDLVIVKNVTKTEVHVGDIVEYTITVTNNGPSNATGVYVMDELDSKLEFVNSTETQGKYNATTHKWTIGNITSGVTVTLTIRAKVIMNGTIPNFANVTGNENDTNLTNNNDTSDNVTALPQVNLTVIKTVTPANATVGDVVNFTITVVNNGLSNATKVNISDVLNPAFGFIEAYGGATPVNGKLTWTIDRIANGTNASVWVKVRLLTNGTFTNVAVANCSENTTNVPSNDTNITVTPNVNLTIVKSANPANASVGDLVNFTITVTNNGLSNATHVVISDTLDSAFELVKSYGNVGMDAGRKVVWVIDKLENGTSTTVWVQVKLLTNGTFTNIAVVNSTENTTNVPSNETNITVAPKANITIMKYADIAEGVNVSVGDAVKFIIVVKNNGPSNATNVIVTDNLNEAFGFKSSNITCERDGQKVIWKFDRINVNETVTIELIVNAIKNGFYFNVAVVNSTESENVTSNETVVTILPAVNLTAVKKANLTGNASAGDLVNFTITIYNKGPSDASNVNITDVLPSGMEYVTSNGGVKTTADGVTSVTWNIGNVKLNQTVEVWVVVKVMANGTLRNVVKANSSENTTGITNYTDLNVTPAVDLVINKTVDKTNVTVGDTVVYTITVKNNGPSNATDVEVTENLKGGVEITANPSKGTYVNNKWTIPLLEANETATLTLTVKVLKAETIENSVVVKANENDTNLTNNNYTSENVTVNKLDTPIKLETENITYGDDEPIKVILPAKATGTVNITVGNVTYPDQPINNGVVELTIPDLAGGEYNVTVTYPGDGRYEGNSTAGKFKVSPRVPVIRIEVVDIMYGEVEVLNVTVNAPGFVNITVNNGVGSIIAGLNHTVQEKNLLRALRFTPYDGEATWKLIRLAVGQYPVTATYLGNENYTSVSADAVFKVRALPSVVNVTADDIYVGEDAIIKVSLTPDATGNVTLTIDGKKYTVNITGGKGHLTVPGLKAGLKNVTVKYEGDEHYLPSENSTTFNVKKIKPPIDVDSEDIYVGEDETITVTLPSDATGTVTITVNGKKYTADVVSGIAEFTIPGLKAGKYTVDASYSGDDKYLPTNGEDNFKVSKLKPDITVDAPDITVGEDGTITVTLPDDATGTVTIEVEGKTYTAKVKNGKAVFKVPGLSVGVHGIKVWYSGDDKYLPTETAGDIYVKPINKEEDSHNQVGLEKHPTGNPIIVLILVLVSMVGVGFRKFKK